jgi:large-conductance mechanosensitive channel
MFFVVGLVVFILGCIIMRCFGITGLRLTIGNQMNWGNYIGSVMFYTGIALMLFSICKKLWHLMP